MQHHDVLWCILLCALALPHAMGDNSENSTQEVGNGASDKSNSSEQVCYDLLGCFSTSDKWSSAERPCAHPQDPKNLGTKITFYSKPFPKRKHEVYKYPDISIRKIPFQKAHSTYVIVHGSNAGPTDPWVGKVKDSLIYRKSANVLVLDWSIITKTGYPLNQLAVCGNSRTVAREVSAVLWSLHRQRGLNFTRTHCIGHSFGAHVCAYIGKNVTGHLGSITGLDACQPSFEGYSEDVRLVKGDARFVVAIHTDAAPFIPTGSVGFVEPYADVDFYFNGGFSQPGCVTPKFPNPLNPIAVVKAAVEEVSGLMSCPHSRSHAYYSEALQTRNCTFWGHKADATNMLEGVANTLTNGKITKFTALGQDCKEPESCVPVGLDTELYPGRGVYVVTTRGEQPFCVDINEPLSLKEKMHAGSKLYAALQKIMKVKKPWWGASKLPPQTTRPHETCFPLVGCFSNQAPWTTLERPTPPPQSPNQVSTFMYFYNRDLEGGMQFAIFPDMNLTEVPYDTDKDTFILFHGLNNNGLDASMIRIKNALLQRVDANVFVVDWGAGASNKYLIAVSNSRVAGTLSALVLNATGIPAAKMHIIGHSLGSHAGSYMAKNLTLMGKRPGQMTGLDPAGGVFEGFEAAVRFDRKDAEYVDVIHTNAILTGYKGMLLPHGDVDFYVNGGTFQPGCFQQFVSESLPVMTCSHQFSNDIYTEALKRPGSIVGQRASIKNIISGSVNTLTGAKVAVMTAPLHCDKVDCLSMGLETIKSSKRGVFEVHTKAKPNYTT